MSQFHRGRDHQALLSRVGEAEPQLGADYIGSDFGLLRTGTTAQPPSGTPIADVLRWWLFHETAAEIIEDRVILWVRADLVLPVTIMTPTGKNEQ